MATILVSDTNLTNIANAIREKNGETTSYKVDEMAEAISGIEASSSVETVDSQIWGSSPWDEIEVTYVNQDFEIKTVMANGDVGFRIDGKDEVLKNSILVTSGAAYSCFISSGGIEKLYDSSTLCVWKVTEDFSLDFEL